MCFFTNEVTGERQGNQLRYWNIRSSDENGREAACRRVFQNGDR